MVNMKKILYSFTAVFMLMNLYSCCKCMNCPGFGQSSGSGSDEICQEGYEEAKANNPAVYTLTWAEYSDYMLQSGCKCVE
jgi:hypothetical protein